MDGYQTVGQFWLSESDLVASHFALPARCATMELAFGHFFLWASTAGTPMGYSGPVFLEGPGPRLCEKL